MVAAPVESPPDECFRCGYDLRGIADDRPCPECGLAAERSRRTTDELHETRPRWLRTITAGAFLVLLSMLLTMAWPFCARIVMSPLRDWLGRVPWYEWHEWDEVFSISGWGVAAIILFAGVLLLTRPEGYVAADRADRGSRRWLRLAALMPSVIFTLACLALRWAPDPSLTPAGLVVRAVVVAPLPLLLFIRLRGLAKRARSAHLAEHCLIVGIGATSAVLCLAVGMELSQIDSNWARNSTTCLILVVICTLPIFLFWLWSIYLLLRFAIAFALAARQASRKWRRDDHSLVRPGA